MTLRARIRKRPIRFGFLMLVVLLFVVSIGSFWIGVGYFETDGYVLFAGGGLHHIDVTRDPWGHHAGQRNAGGIQFIETQKISSGLVLEWIAEFMGMPRCLCEHAIWIPFGLPLLIAGVAASAAFWWPMEWMGLRLIRTRIKKRPIRFAVWVIFLLGFVEAGCSYWTGAGYYIADGREIMRLEKGLLHLASPSFYGRLGTSGGGFQTYDAVRSNSRVTASDFWKLPWRFRWECVVIPLGLPLILLGLLTTAWFWWPIVVHGTGCCQRCGYDLRGNVSGKCSECGTVVVREEAKAA